MTTGEQKEAACWEKESESGRLLKEEVLEVNQTAWLRPGKKLEGLQGAELQDHRGMVCMLGI